MARILVVEDNPQNLKLTTVILQGGGHTVVSALDSESAQRALARDVPDLIVMDVSLPGKDGIEFTRELRQLPATARVPILGLSALAMPGDARKALDAGCDDYMTKPIRRATLLGSVTALLRTTHRLATDPAPGRSPADAAAPEPAADAPAGQSALGRAREGGG